MEAIEPFGSSEMNSTEIYTKADTLDGSVIFHTIYDVLGFVLYMHQQIPSTVQDMSIEFDTMHSEYNQLETALAETELKASLRRYHISKMRDIKLGIRRLEKLMNALSSMKIAIQLIINEIPSIEEIILALGASPQRPQHIYDLSFSHGTAVSPVENDFARSKAADGLSRKAIRTLISKGAGSVTYPGSSKLFLLIKAPASFNQPQHFLPKRDFRYNRKIVPFRLLFKCQKQYQEVVAPPSEDFICLDLISRSKFPENMVLYNFEIILDSCYMVNGDETVIYAITACDVSMSARDKGPGHEHDARRMNSLSRH